MLRAPAAGACLLAVSVSLSTGLEAQSSKAPLSTTDIDDIAQLLKVEDLRRFDAGVLERLLSSPHPEVRRRAVQTIGRVPDAGADTLLVGLRTDPSAAVVATVAFAYGQLQDERAVEWLSEQLSDRGSSVVVAREAARSLGKIRTEAARRALTQFLRKAPVDDATAPVAGEALLSLGRFIGPIDLDAISRWTQARDVDLRWRATWALYRPRDVAAFDALVRLSRDPSADVRFWAARGLGVPPPPAPARGATSSPPPVANPYPLSDADRTRAAARLREAVTDRDRRVRTEALRALATFDDEASFQVVLASIDASDTWISVSAVESLGRFASHAAEIVPRLVKAAGADRPRAVRITALAPLAQLAPSAALDLATSLLHDASVVARTTAIQTLGRLGSDGRARLDAAVAADPTLGELVALQGTRRPSIPRPTRAEADYRTLVERWIVPAYRGRPGPRVVFETPRGSIEVELYAGDAPFGVEYLLDVVRTGAIVGSEFGRVVPNFVAQERAIRDDAPLRDEVSVRGLTRGNLSWASSGLDTGRPGYTFGSTPQPHNEGAFTALGRVVHGMDVVDRLELGDKITGARIVQ